MPRRTAPRTSPTQDKSPAAADTKPKAVGSKKVTLGNILGKRKAIGTPAAAQAPARDELEEYLSEPVEDDLSIKLLDYWKVKEITWPRLAKMVKQFLAAPASSAGPHLSVHTSVHASVHTFVHTCVTRICTYLPHFC